jgi:hypothetical protein
MIFFKVKLFIQRLCSKTHEPFLMEGVNPPSSNVSAEEDKDSVIPESSGLDSNSAIEMENTPASSESEIHHAHYQPPAVEDDSVSLDVQMQDHSAYIATSSNVSANFDTAMTTSLLNQAGLTNEITSFPAFLGALTYWSIRYLAELQKSSKPYPLHHPLKLTPRRPSLWT